MNSKWKLRILFCGTALLVGAYFLPRSTSSSDSTILSYGAASQRSVAAPSLMELTKSPPMEESLSNLATRHETYAALWGQVKSSIAESNPELGNLIALYSLADHRHLSRLGTYRYIREQVKSGAISEQELASLQSFYYFQNLRQLVRDDEAVSQIPFKELVDKWIQSCVGKGLKNGEMIDLLGTVPVNQSELKSFLKNPDAYLATMSEEVNEASIEEKAPMIKYYCIDETRDSIITSVIGKKLDDMLSQAQTVIKNRFLTNRISYYKKLAENGQL